MANYLGKWHAWISRNKNGEIEVLYTETANPTLSSSGNTHGYYDNGVFYGYDYFENWQPIHEIGNNVEVHDVPGVNYNKRTGNYIVIGVYPPLSEYGAATYTVFSYSDDFKPFVVDEEEDPEDPSTWTNTPKYIFKTWDGKTYERIVGQTYYSYVLGYDITFSGNFSVTSIPDPYIEPRGSKYVDGLGIDWIVTDPGPS